MSALNRYKRNIPDDDEQSKMFIETAREIEADEKQSAADDIMKKMAKTPPKPRKKDQ